MRRWRGRNRPGRPLSRGALHTDTLLEVGQQSVGEPEQNQNPVQRFFTLTLDPAASPVSPKVPGPIPGFGSNVKHWNP